MCRRCPALGQKQLAHFLLSPALIYAALRSARGLPLVALALLPIANAAHHASSD